MSLSDDMRKFNEKMERRLTSVFVGAVDAVYESITVGSPITGAPGQPVDSGNLLKSWEKKFHTENSAKVSTEMFYASSIEDGVNMSNGTLINLDSTVGGFHSVALTRLGFQALLDDVTKRVVGSDA